MNKTEKTFHQSRKDRGLTDFVHFGRAVVATGLSRRTIQMRMSKLLNKADYPEFTLDEMLDHFEQLSKMKNA